MATGFLSNAQAMTRAVQGFEESSVRARSTMSALEADLTSALSQYRGNQAVAFWQLHTQLQEKMQEASQQLDVMSNLVNKSFTNYGSGDSHVADTLTSLNGQVGSGAAFTRLTGA